MITRHVTIERDGKFWLVHIDGTNGLTQARRYDEVELMAREYVSLVEDVPIEQVNIASITVKDVTDRLTQVMADRQKAHALEVSASQTIGEIAAGLRAQSVSFTDIGAILGVSHQRAHQLAHA